MRDIDGTGHHPGKVQPGEPHEILLNPPADPALRCAWYEGYLAAVGVVAARAQAQLDEITRERM